MAYGIRPNFGDDQSADTDAPTNGSTYLDIDPNQALYDPGFLTDMRDFLEENGESAFLTDDEVRDRFFLGQVWTNFNTGGAVREAMRSSGYSQEQQNRSARLNQLYNQFPNPWEKGGRGWAGVGQGALAAAADPINFLYPAYGATQAGAKAARAAYAAGKNTTSEAIKAGVKTGIKQEMAIGALAGGVHDAAMQVRDKNLGVQDEFSTGRLAGQTAIGAGIGIPVGTGVGAIGGAFGGIRQMRADRAGGRGLLAEETARNEQLLLEDMRENKGSIAIPEADDNFLPTRQELTEAEELEQIERLLNDSRRNLDEAIESDVDAEVLGEHRREVNMLARLREFRGRLANESEQIRILEQSNDLSKLQLAANRRANFENAYSEYRRLFNRALREEDTLAVDNAVADAGKNFDDSIKLLEDQSSANKLADPDAEAPDAPEGGAPEGPDAPEGDAPDQTPPLTPEAETPPTGAVEGEGGSTTSPLEDALKYSRDSTKQALAELRAKLEITDEEIAQLISDGRVAVGKKGQMVKQSISDIERIKTAERLEAEAEPSPTVAEEPDTTPVETTPEGEVATVDPVRLDRDVETMVAWLEDTGQFKEIAESDFNPSVIKSLTEANARMAGVTSPTDEISAAVLKKFRDALQGASESESTIKVLTKTEVRKRNAFLRKLKKEKPELSDSARETLADDFIISERAAVEDSKAKPRSTQTAIEEKGVFEGAGRTADGRIQSFLKYNTPIAKGSDYTIIDRIGSQSFEDAYIRAKTPGELDIQPFIADDARTSFVDENGTKRLMKKGEAGFVDGVTGKAFQTKEMAVSVREQRTPKTEVDDGAVAAFKAEREQELLKLQAEATQARINGDFDEFERIIMEIADKQIEVSPETRKAVDNFKRGKVAAETRSSDTGDKLLIVKSKDDGTVRMMTPRQAENGKSLKDIIGQRADSPRSNPDNWIIKYAPRDQYTRGQDNLVALFDSLPEETSVPSQSTGANPSRQAATETITIEEAQKTRLFNKEGVLPNEAADVTALRDAVDLAIDSNLIEGNYDIGTFIREATLHDADMLLSVLANIRWSQMTGPRFDMAVNAINGLENLIARRAPEGIQRNTTNLEESVASLEAVLGSHEAETIAMAKSMLSQLAGGKKPIFAALEGQQNLGRYNGATGEVGLNTSMANNVVPQVETIFHETGHWVYHNILTPADRAEFWGYMKKYYVDGQPDFKKIKEGLHLTGDDVVSNSIRGPQEFFANQFAMWVGRKRVPEAAEESFWRRMASYIKNVFERYAFGAQIDPDLERLFAKALPDKVESARAKGMAGSPQTEAGKIWHGRVRQMRELMADMDDAITRDSADGIINAADQIQMFMLSIAQRYKNSKGPYRTGSLEPIKRNPALWTAIHNRVDNIDEIRGGKNYDYDSLGDDAARNELGYEDLVDMSIGDIQDQADKIKALYLDGYGDVFFPALAERASDGKIIEGGKTFDPAGGRTAIRSIFQRVEDALAAAYYKVEDGSIMPGHTPKWKRGKPADSGSKKKRERESSAVTAMAKNDAKQKKKPAAEKKKTKVDKQTADSSKSMKDDELRRKFLEHRGTDYGDQLADEIVRREKTGPILKKVPVAKKYKDMYEPELLEELMDALGQGESKVADEISFEIRRRRANKALKKGADSKEDYKKVQITPVFYSRIEVVKEAADSTGVSSARGIPANSRASIRNLLSYITHREPEIEYGARTLAYRMLNLMGKTNRFLDGKLNVVDADTVARLSGMPSSESGATVFADYRSPEFKKFRTDMRQVAIGLNKGNVSPFEVVKSVAEAVMRSDVLSADEQFAIKNAYFALPDSEKDRLFASYAQKYGTRERPLDDLLASEYMSEQLTLYMAERVAKGDIYQAVATGDIGAIQFKGTIERALDRIVEYVAYLVNGLVGRDDIKQQFRRIFLYGNMLDGALSPKAYPPMQRAGAGIYNATSAQNFVRDTFRARSQTAQANIREYQGGFATQIPNKYLKNFREPVVVFHATPSGKRLNHLDNPDVQLQPSRQGNHGSGNYFSFSATAAHDVYALRPTRDGYRNMIERLPGDEYPPELKEGLTETADYLSELQRGLAIDRNVYSNLLVDFEGAYREGQLDRYYGYAFSAGEGGGDMTGLMPSNPYRTYEQVLAAKDDILEDFGQIIAYRADRVKELEENLAEFDIVVDPMVIPVYPAAQKVANFTPESMHRLGEDSGLFADMLVRLQNSDEISDRQINNLLSKLSSKGDSFSAEQFYDEALSLFQGTHSMRADKFNSMLKEAGYDSLIYVHSNSVPHVGVNEFRSPSGQIIPVSARTVDHLALVIFDSPDTISGQKTNTKFKHTNSTEFDVDENRLFGRGDAPMPRGVAGHIAGLAAEGKIKDIGDVDVGSFAEAIEVAGSNEMAQIVQTLSRKRNLNDEEIAELGSFSPVKFIGRSSERMNKMGLKWLGSWYRDVYPDISQRFAKKYFPLMHSLNRLPDAQGKGKRWARRVSMDAISGQPKSHERLVRALRYGENSRFFKALSTQEKGIYGQIRRAFDAEREELLEAGVNVGRRKNYLPQVWNSESISRNRERFLDAMIHYYKVEHTARGELADEQAAREFAENMFGTLSDQSNQGTFIPGGGGSRNPTSDALDYSRMIELEKYPESISRMEEFLEGDLEFLLTKYFEGSSRRLAFMEKLGVNTHGYYDYMVVRNGGVQGIAELLSKNKEFTTARQGYNNQTGFVESIDFKETVGMPFANRPGDAAAFADNLLSTFLSKGSVPARKMLEDIAPPSYGQMPNPTYQRRVDAIIGALEDFRGNKVEFSHDDMTFLENAMNVAMKKPPIGTTNLGRQASQAVRTFNNVTLLGFTTLTSLSDFVLPLVRTGDMPAFLRALKNFATNDKDYRREIFNIGASVESIAHNRMIHMYGQVHNKASDAFFNLTMLTPWTDTMRLLATGVGLEAFKTQQIKLRRHYDPSLPVQRQGVRYRTAHRLMARYGLEDFLPGGSRFNENLGDVDLGEDRVLRVALNKFVNDTVFAPNADDIPMWAHTPSGQILFQLKTFPLMMGRMTLDVIKEGAQGNIAPLLALSTAGVGMGAATLAAKDFAQFRGGDDEKSAALRERSLEKTLGITPNIHQDTDAALALYWEGLVQLGGLGLFADLAYQAAASADDGAYGEMAFASRLLGPTVGLGVDVYRMGRGFGDAIVKEPGEPTGDERQAARLLSMRVPVAGQVRAFREGAADLMGEATRGGGSQAFSSGAFSSDFGSDF